MIQKKELQIKTEEDGNFKAEKYKIEIEVNILNTTPGLDSNPTFNCTYTLLYHYEYELLTTELTYLWSVPLFSHSCLAVVFLIDSMVIIYGLLLFM